MQTFPQANADSYHVPLEGTHTKVFGNLVATCLLLPCRKAPVDNDHELLVAKVTSSIGELGPATCTTLTFVFHCHAPKLYNWPAGDPCSTQVIAFFLSLVGFQSTMELSKLLIRGRTSIWLGSNTVTISSCVCCLDIPMHVPTNVWVHEVCWQICTSFLV
jgi:hypothetical protein